MSDQVFCKDCARYVYYENFGLDACFTGPLCPVGGTPTRVDPMKQNLGYDCALFVPAPQPKRRWWRCGR